MGVGSSVGLDAISAVGTTMGVDVGNGNDVTGKGKGVDSAKTG